MNIIMKAATLFKRKKQGIAISRLINPSQFKDLEDIIKCKICFQIISNPMDCISCQHSFCYDCIENLREEGKACPFNCELTNTSINPSSLGIKSMLSLLKFKCLNADCTEEIAYNDLKIHDKSCRFTPVNCPKCNKQIKTFQLEGHVKDECELRLTRCQVCQEDILWKEYDTHLAVCNIIRQSLINVDVGDSKELIYPGAQFVKTMLNHLGKMTEDIIRKTATVSVKMNTSNEDFSFAGISNKFSASNENYNTNVISCAGSNDDKLERLNDKLELLFKLVSEKNDRPNNFNNSSEDKFNKINDRLDRIEAMLKGREYEYSKLETSEKESYKNIEKDKVSETEREVITNNNTILQHSMAISIKEIDDIVSDKLNYLENTINEKFHDLQTDIDDYFKKEFEFVYCQRCKKIENGMCFRNCSDCNRQFCKDCGIKCKECDKIYCQECVSCPRCQDTICIGCRKACISCDKEEGATKLYCSSCITECKNCNTTNCIECLKTCTQCNVIICKNTICSNFCKHCYISLCKKCQQISENPITPCIGNETHYSCKNCYITCAICRTETCKTCISKCKKCHKSLCMTCIKDCPSCKEGYCEECSKKTFEVKCHKCAKFFCNSCINNDTSKCSQCKEIFCKSCAYNCRVCGIGLCSTCVSRCKQCEEPNCHKCLISCQCDEVSFCLPCKEDILPIHPHQCNSWLNNSPNFTGVKTRANYPLPTNFEAKFFIEKMKGVGVNIGLTDNNTFSDNSIIIVDQIWTMRLKTGMKYSTEKSVEPFLKHGAKEYDVVYMKCEDGQLAFSINDDSPQVAYTLDSSKKYYLYIENEEKARVECKVCLIYVIKI
jgi:hypothetical protein